MSQFNVSKREGFEVRSGIYTFRACFLLKQPLDYLESENLKLSYQQITVSRQIVHCEMMFWSIFWVKQEQRGFEDVEVSNTNFISMLIESFPWEDIASDKGVGAYAGLHLKREYSILTESKNDLHELGIKPFFLHNRITPLN
ncbi:hypothetical protein LOAG_04894 [Loa loa]|uniref:Uncharacterized protein n=1 Tax=Loa loa TaxID=7209 RepID=A0A1S0U1N9_LOALO|nr:hypothetical protein LOAG_04894 [Loa loa]EFO23593.1 hypothetical protein LOAG_04894 [Loa loa]